MTALSCLAIGVAFLLAVGLLVFAGVVLGFSIPVKGRRPDWAELLRRAADSRGEDPPRPTGEIDPPGPAA